MNYDSIIIEMLSRIQKLEMEVAELKVRLGDEDAYFEGEPEEEKSSEKHFSTRDIKDFIEGLKDSAKSNGEKTLTLISGDIHKLLKLRRCMPMVCNAMRQCMNGDDVVVHETPSGQSSTLEIQYDLDKAAEAAENAPAPEEPKEPEAE